MSALSQYDGRRPEPPYQTDVEIAVSEERERCARIAETLNWSFFLFDSRLVSSKQIAEQAGREIANAIRAD